MENPGLKRMVSMREQIKVSLYSHRNDLAYLLSRYVDQGKGILQPHHLVDELESMIPIDDGLKGLSDGSFKDVLSCTQEAIVLPPYVAMAIRPRPGVWEFVLFNFHELNVEQLNIAEYLKFKERLEDESFEDNYVLELDFGPFNSSFPRPSQPSWIGNGVQFLNRHLSSRMFHDSSSMEPLFDFLQAHKYKGHVMVYCDKF